MNACVCNIQAIRNYVHTNYKDCVRVVHPPHAHTHTQLGAVESWMRAMPCHQTCYQIFTAYLHTKKEETWDSVQIKLQIEIHLNVHIWKIKYSSINFVLVK